MNQYWLPIAALLSMVGCGGKDETLLTTPPGPDTPGTPTPADDAPLPEGSLREGPYLAALAVQGMSETQSSYTAVLPALDTTANDRLRAGLESTGYVTPSAYGGFVYVPGGATPSITRYAVDDDGGFSEAGSVSFAAFGVTRVPKAPVIGADMIAPDKAYYYDSTNRQLIVWNPSSMELTGTTIDLAAVLTEDIPSGWNPFVFLNYSDGFARHVDDRLFIPVSWRNWDDPDTFYASAGLLVIDTERDEVVHLLKDERLADSIYTVVTESGDLYLFSGALGVAHHQVRGTAAGGAALRVRSGEESFDPGYYLDLDAAVGGRPATTPASAGGSAIYVRAYHEEEQPITPEITDDPNLLVTERAWRYWKVDLTGSSPASEVTALPSTSTDGYFYDIVEENRRFLGVMEADYSRTTLYEDTPWGFVEALQVTGTLDVLSLLERKR